jgi:hypothetical protein
LSRKGTVSMTLVLSGAARSALRKRHELRLQLTASMPGERSAVARLTLTTRGR